MSNLAFRPAALLVLSTLALLAQANGGASDATANNMLAKLQQMRNSVHHEDSPSWPTQPTPPTPTQNPAGATTDYDSTQSDSGYPEPVTAVPMTTHKPGFMDTASPKNRAVVTGVVAGAAVSAVAGGIAIAIEETKINKRIKEGKPPKPLFPWLAPKGGSRAPAPAPAPPAFSPPKRISARTEGRAHGKEAPATTIAPTTPAPTTLPTTTTRAAAVLGEEVPLPVWIALAALACCCLAAIIKLIWEALRHGSGRQKRSAKTKLHERETSRSDSVDFSDDGSFYSDQYSDPSVSYSAVAPADMGYYDSPAASVQYSYDYSQQGSYQSSALSTYGNYPATYVDVNAGASASTYVNPHPNAQAYVSPHDNLYYYNTNS